MKAAEHAAREWLGDQGLELYKIPGQFDAVATALAWFITQREQTERDACASICREVAKNELREAHENEIASEDYHRAIGSSDGAIACSKAICARTTPMTTNKERTDG